MIKTDGVGNREVTAAEELLAEQMGSSGCSSMHLVELQLAGFDPGSPPVQQKPICLLVDSMGQCIPITDSVIQVVARDDWNFANILSDVLQDKIVINTKNIIVWAGANAVRSAQVKKLSEEMKALCSALKLKNEGANLFVSALLPQPRVQHVVQDMIASVNDMIRNTAVQLQEQGVNVSFLPSHQLYLDKDNDIVRPITDNFEDGFHLNLHGAHRLRQYWLQQLGLSK